MPYSTPLISVILFIFLTGCATSPSQNLNKNSTQANNSTSANSTNDDPIVCKRTIKTGTRFSTKVCRSKSKWALEREQTQRALESKKR